MTDKDYDKLKLIEECIQAFDTEKLYESSIAFFKALDYQSNKTQLISPNNFEGFIDSFNLSKNSINKEKALVDQWKRIEFIFQVADSEITRIQSLFDTREVDKNEYQSFLFFTIQLKEDSYKRGDLVKITRELNVPFNMPVIVLFQYANKLTLSIIDRRLNKRDTSKDVLEKVTLIKDIDIANPQRAHKEILKDLSLNELYKQYEFHSFVKLHEAWKATLNISELNKKFYKELAYWYFWALQEVKFPADELKDDKTRNPVNVIRLITRLIFVWFLKEKNLVPDDLFNKRELDKILDYKDKTGSTYYKAILQNLFFATLNTEMNKDVKDKNKISRTFVNRNTGVPHYFRYGRLIKDQDKFSALMDNIPFLNGGLFECLDKRFKDNSKDIFIDGFTQQVKNEEIVVVPDYLFFSNVPRNIDLNNTFHTKGKKYPVTGLIDILSRYKFTIEENTPVEEEVALDPELLGKVFENLLASYNEETETTARKLTGSFYTPREIVNYIVDESLITYLKSTVSFQLADESESAVSFQLADEIDYSPFVEFDPNNEIIIKEGNLPHWSQKGVWYFVTFRLVDSIPAEKVEQLRVERVEWLKKHKNESKKEYSIEQLKEYYRLFSERVEGWLNAGHGSCVLKDEANAAIIANSLKYFDGEKYNLDEWVVMPNHVHVLVKPIGKHNLSEILHSWKSYSANKINANIGKSGQLWMHESYDHIVRNEDALKAIRNYIRNNPRKAGIVSKASSFVGTTLTQSKDASDTQLFNPKQGCFGY